jgi:hypothetical protein
MYPGAMLGLMVRFADTRRAVDDPDFGSYRKDLQKQPAEGLRGEGKSIVKPHANDRAD